MNKLGELFKFFKLTPRVFDPLIDEPRIALAAVREPEREIMRIVVRDCRMDRKEFIKSFQGSESDSRLGQPRRHARKTWVPKSTSIKTSYSDSSAR